MADAIHARTDGIPLHVEELLAVLAAATVEGVGDVRRADVPETVEDTIIARIEQRSPAARRPSPGRAP